MTIEVDHPPHYARWKMEPVEFIAINDMPWWMANVIKYIMRYDAKDGLKDLYKARSYLEMIIRKVEGEKRFWDKPVKEEREAKSREDKVFDAYWQKRRDEQAQAVVKTPETITWNPGIAGYAHGPVTDALHSS